MEAGIWVVLTRLAASCSAAPSSIALRAASDRNDRFVPVDGDDLGGEDCVVVVVVAAAVDDDAGTDVTVLVTVVVFAFGEVEGTLVK